MDAPGDSAIGGTYVGNPVACQAAIAVLDEIDRSDLSPVPVASARPTRARLEALQARVLKIGDVRGLGSTLGLELVRDLQTKDRRPRSRPGSLSWPWSAA